MTARVRARTRGASAVAKRSGRQAVASRQVAPAETTPLQAGAPSAQRFSTPSTCGGCGSRGVIVIHWWCYSTETDASADCLCGAATLAATWTERISGEGRRQGQVHADTNGVVEWDDDWPRDGWPPAGGFEVERDDLDVSCAQCFEASARLASDADVDPPEPEFCEFSTECRACGAVLPIEDERFEAELWG